MQREQAGIARAGAGEPDMAGLEAREIRPWRCASGRPCRISLAVTGEAAKLYCLSHERIRTRHARSAAAGPRAPAPRPPPRQPSPRLLTGEFPDPVEITLPERPDAVPSRLPSSASGDGTATAGVDQGCRRRSRRDPWRAGAGHRAAAARRAAAFSSRPGQGVGTVTLPGLPLPPGEPAINPVPRQMMRAEIAEVACALGCDRRCRDRDLRFRDGEAMAAKTLNAAARHRRRPVDPRHHRHRRALFLRCLDRTRSIAASTSRARPA